MLCGPNQKILKIGFCDVIAFDLQQEFNSQRNGGRWEVRGIGAGRTAVPPIRQNLSHSRLHFRPKYAI